LEPRLKTVAMNKMYLRMSGHGLYTLTISLSGGHHNARHVTDLSKAVQMSLVS